jgi:hypothetical protein
VESVTTQRENYRERAEQLLKDIRTAGTGSHPAMAAEAQACASLAIVDAIYSSSSALQKELRLIVERLQE